MSIRTKTFSILQKVGRSFMFPIALLPAAGLLLGIGISFTNPVMLETYGLTDVICEGSAIYTILDIMAKCGSVIFDNLALLFAMGVAIGMAKKEKAVAALSGAISCLVMNMTISVMIDAHGGVEAMAPNTTTTFLGISTLQMGSFGGILVGLGVAALHNRFCDVKLPRAFAFFGGNRFVPIISSQAFIVIGIIQYYIWPVIQRWIGAIGTLVYKSGYAGTCIYGFVEHILLPFGLHHVFYTPFWYTGMGGEAMVDGVMIQGAQNIFFAELASKEISHFSVSATRFMSGEFPYMIFGLPGAALAMYVTAKPGMKKTVGSLLLSAAMTSIITGITEPIEFTFLFVAPVLYVIHCIYAGISFMLMHILGVGVGLTFSGGLIDLVLFGIMQGNAKTSWLWIPVVGAVYFLLYFFTFYFLIKKFDFETPGREREDTANEQPEEYSGGEKNSKTTVSELIVQGLGGKRNIIDMDCCATRLRITLSDSGMLDENILKQSGAIGVIQKGDGVQLVYGPDVTAIKSDLEEYLDAVHDNE